MSLEPKGGLDMAWLEVSVRADLEAAEAVTEVLSRYSQGGTAIERPLLPPDVEKTLGPRQMVLVKGYLDPQNHTLRQQVEEALWHLRQIYPFEEPAFRHLAEEDWATSWRHDYHIQRIGEHIVVVPSWLEYEPQPEDVVLLVDPGLAFGTGLHPSTRLCLCAMEAMPLAGRSLLDLGSGSGILALYAAKRGAAPVVGLDVDAMSVRVARENAIRNGVAQQITFALGTLGVEGYDLQPDAAAELPRTYQVIVVNILAEVIAALTPAIVAHLAADGEVVAAGIIQDREQAVRAAWAAAGLRVVRCAQEGDWISLIGVKGTGDSA